MKRFTNILFIAATGKDDATALAQAVALAGTNQARLTVVGNVDASDREKESTKTTTRKLLAAMVEQREEELEALIAQTSADRSMIDLKVLVGKAFLEIIREVLRHERDLVIKSAETMDGLAEFFSGTDMKLLRKCPCPVWVINAAQDQGYRKIVAALDYDSDDPEVDDLNGQILQMATSLALSNFAELHIVHTWRLEHEGFMRSARSGLSSGEVDALFRDDESARKEWLESLVARHCASQGKEAVEYLKPKIHLTHGSASKLVPALVESLDAELIVMGTVARSGIPGFLVGNTAENILRQVHCSVLTVKPEGFVSPVTLEK